MRRERFKLADRAVFTRLGSLRNLDKFSCGNEHIDAFFKDEAVKYEEELLAKSYAFCDVENDNAIICMFSVSCDGIHTALLPGPVKNKIQRAIPNAKRMRRYPAILIGRIGVSSQYRRMGVGSQVLTYIKEWFLHPMSKCACRYLIVDAVNDEDVMTYYEANGFRLLYLDEQAERTAFSISGDEPLRTRMMYCDLRLWLLQQSV